MVRSRRPVKGAAAAGTAREERILADIRLVDVSKQYGNVRVIENVTMTIGSGEQYCQSCIKCLTGIA